MGSGVALAGFREQLFLAQQGARSQTIEIYVATSVTSSGTAWPSRPVAVIQVDASSNTVTSDPTAPPGAHPLALSNPGLCVYGDLLYLACTDADQNVWICSSADGVSWSGFAQLSQQVAGVQAAASPAPSALGADTLALAYPTASAVAVLDAT
jgi:hypothetical protein